MIKRDNREPYLTNTVGQPLALVVAGPVGNIPPHEWFVHDGTAHQDPVIQYFIIKEGWWIFATTFSLERRWYPLCRNVYGVGAKMDELMIAISRYDLQDHQFVAVMPMPQEVLQQAVINENKTQKNRGVWMLREDRGNPEMWQ